MKVNIRKIKQAYVFCQNDETHGKTPLELNIEISSYKIKVWLCQQCLKEFSDLYDTTVDKLWHEFVQESQK